MPEFNIAKTADLIDRVSRNFIVRPTGISNVIGLSGFVFDIVDEETVSIDSDITDHYVEDNKAIQDHVALRPERFTVRGFIGELSQLFPSRLLEVVTKVQRLVNLAVYQPTLTPQASQENAKVENDNIQKLTPLDTAQNLYDIFTNKNTTATKQQRGFNFFYSMYLTRQFFIVETPYNIFTDMMIESLRVTQGSDTNIISDFGITFKKIRTADTEFIPVVTVFDGRSADQISDTVEKGKSQGEPATPGFLKSIYSP